MIKNMTQEEKARAYDEVMNKIKPLYEQAKKDGNPIWSTYEYLIPQLAESEDERTRKELIEFIQWSEDRGITRHDFHQAKRPSEWIAYLEKQKYDRMKPVYDNQDSFESALEKAWKDYNDSGARTVDGCEDDYVECAHAKGFREGYLFGIEKQKDKMTAEEYEKSELFQLKLNTKYANGYQDGLVQKEQKLTATINGETIPTENQSVDIPLPEWSEEDEQMLQSIIKDFRAGKVSTIGQEQWLKSLCTKFW